MGYPMSAKLINWVLGSRSYTVSCENASKAADILSRSGANIRAMRIREGTLCFSLPLRDCEAVERILSKGGIKYNLVKERGLRYLFHRYRRRIGIPIGILLFFFVLWFSEQFVWTIEVSGNSTVPSDVIIERLQGFGCGVGTYIPKVDFDDLHNSFLLKYDDIAWISVNVRGTDALVEVREALIPEKAPDESIPYNLVAKEDGIVEYVEILRGKPIAKEDELVRQGELLASGITEGKHGLMFFHARGRVMAQVKRKVHIEVPLESMSREATGKVYSEKYLNIFGISLKFFANTGKMASEYDKIEYDMSAKQEKLRIFDAVEVPIWINEAVFTEYERVPVLLNEDEAKSEAYRRLREECASITEGCELVSREISAGISEGVYIIDCELTVVCDIAEERPIYTENTTN